MPDLRESEYAWFIEVIRSNQDTLLHKVQRNEAVREQLETNRLAIVAAQERSAEHNQDTKGGSDV